MAGQNKIAVNTYIRTLYSAGFSSIMIYFYNTNLAFCFAPYSGVDYNGLSKFDITKTIRTTVNYDGASALYQIASSIFDGKNPETQINAVLSCNNATLILEYKPDENNQMYTYLTIDKNNEAIVFRFPIHTYKVRENGQIVTKTIQSGLGTFAMTLEGYLSGINASGHLNKLPEDYDDSQSS